MRAAIPRGVWPARAGGRGGGKRGARSEVEEVMVGIWSEGLGEAEVGIHQISEILAVKGVELVGPLPPDIQNYTVYAAGIGASAKDDAAAKALIAMLAGPEGAGVGASVPLTVPEPNESAHRPSIWMA